MFGIHLHRLRVRMSWDLISGCKCKAWLEPPDHTDGLQRQHQVLLSYAESSGVDRRNVSADAKLVGMPLTTFLRMCEDLCHEVEIRRRWEESLSQQSELMGSDGTRVFPSKEALSDTRALDPRPQRRWWYKRKKDGEKRNQLRAALVTLSEVQLKSLVLGVVAEMEGRIPRLAWAGEGTLSTERAKSDSTEELLRHKDLEKWVGAGL
ncbi:hypothetical protein B0A55_07185 [Friedmanniomyces simplex]|uniref:Uncharacterized protein n=1 Tax=Friedmanniomyces simplex TaxID=329884 RepID=A0A4U0XC53_9PEZI|nr:hypothetical protein B0A55_07185 [Friedmanniomyces simplex]